MMWTVSEKLGYDCWRKLATIRWIDKSIKHFFFLPFFEALIFVECGTLRVLLSSVFMELICEINKYRVFRHQNWLKSAAAMAYYDL